MIKNVFHSMVGEMLVINQDIPDPISDQMDYDNTFQPKISKNNIFELSRKPTMPFVLELIARLREKKEITLKARGNSIANALSVANLLTNNHIENPYKTQQATIDLDPNNKMSSSESAHEMIIKITYQKNS